MGLLAVYIAMIVEDIRNRNYCQQDIIDNTHTKMIFFFFSETFLKEQVASTNVKNVQTMVIEARVQRSSAPLE